MKQDVTITIENKTIIRVLAVVLGFIVAFLAVQKMSTALMTIGIAFFLAMALNPIVTALARRIPGKSARGLATGVSYLGVILVLGVLITSTVPIVFSRTVDFVNNIPSYMDDLKDTNSPVGHIIDKYSLQDDIDRNVDKIQENSSAIATNIISRVGEFTSSFVRVLTILVLTFLMLVEAPRWQSIYWGFYHNQRMRKRHQKLAERMYRVVTGYVNGQVTIATIAGTCTIVVVVILSSIFNISAGIALPMGGLIFVTGLIPMIGATLGAILVTLFLFLYSLPAALIFLAYFIVYQQFENNVIQPVVQSKALELSPLTVFASALLGFYAMGPIGGFIAIPIAGCIRILLLDYFAHRKHEDPTVQKAAKKELAAVDQGTKKV